MRPAAEEYARVRASDDAWILARFIVPISRLEEFEKAAVDLLPRQGENPWPLSALSGADPREDRRAIDAFHARCSGAVVEAIETRASTPEEVALKAEAFAGLETYLEIPHQDDPAALMAAVVRAGARAKIRTGGITEDALPPAAEVARFIAAAARAGAVFKATAGLHHPLRGEYRLTYEPGSPLGTMHGYVNLFLAAAFARGGADEQALVALLEERDPQAFQFNNHGIRWRDHSLDSAALTAARESFATSYGSCSFREPVEEIRQLGML